MTSNREDKPEPEMQEEAPVVPQPQISPDITSEATLVEISGRDLSLCCALRWCAAQIFGSNLSGF